MGTTVRAGARVVATATRRRNYARQHWPFIVPAGAVVFAVILFPWPFIMVAAVIRGIDALKAFETISVISNGGPGSTSENLNILLYLQAFSFYDMGYASAIVTMFFVLILLMTMLPLHFRQRDALSWPCCQPGDAPPRPAVACAGCLAASAFTPAWCCWPRRPSWSSSGCCRSR